MLRLCLSVRNNYRNFGKTELQVHSTLTPVYCRVNLIPYFIDVLRCGCSHKNCRLQNMFCNSHLNKKTFFDTMNMQENIRKHRPIF
jgi:hypothetical protein